jgi:hypothetical protein
VPALEAGAARSIRRPGRRGAFRRPANHRERRGLRNLDVREADVRGAGEYDVAIRADQLPGPARCREGVRPPPPGSRAALAW